MRKLILRHRPSYLLKFINPIIVRATGIVAISIVVSGLLIVPRVSSNITNFNTPEQNIIQIEEIPQTKIERPEKPPRPLVPIESESVEIDEDITIQETTFDNFATWDTPPPLLDDGPDVIFQDYDEPPVPIGGYNALQRNVVYPEMAKLAEIQGIVVVQAFINKKGHVVETIILHGHPNTGLDEAAIEAIRKTRFKPAKQRDIPVNVWVSIPINFKLR